MYQVVNAGGVSKILYRNDPTETWTELYTAAEIVAVNEANILSAVPEVVTPLEPRCKKTRLRGFRPGPRQTGLHSHTRKQRRLCGESKGAGQQRIMQKAGFSQRGSIMITQYTVIFHDRNISNFQIKN